MIKLFYDTSTTALTDTASNNIMIHKFLFTLKLPKLSFENQVKALFGALDDLCCA